MQCLGGAGHEHLRLAERVQLPGGRGDELKPSPKGQKVREKFGQEESGRTISLVTTPNDILSRLLNAYIKTKDFKGIGWHYIAFPLTLPTPIGLFHFTIVPTPPHLPPQLRKLGQACQAYRGNAAHLISFIFTIRPSRADLSAAKTTRCDCRAVSKSVRGMGRPAWMASANAWNWTR